MTGKGSEVADVMRRRKINIMCVQEMRLKATVREKLERGLSYSTLEVRRKTESALS